MTEDEAKLWVRETFGEVALSRLTDLADSVLKENRDQNLIAPSTVDAIWSRHIADSAQLIRTVDPRARSWLDIGSGAGFPGLVVAMLADIPVTLAEPRRRRADFLSALVASLGLNRVSVAQSRVETLPPKLYDVISARAVAGIDALFAMSRKHAGPETVFVLPRGAGWREELDGAARRWHAVFHVEHSLTNPASAIIVARQVRGKK